MSNSKFFVQETGQKAIQLFQLRLRSYAKFSNGSQVSASAKGNRTAGGKCLVEPSGGTVEISNVSTFMIGADKKKTEERDGKWRIQAGLDVSKANYFGVDGDNKVEDKKEEDQENDGFRTPTSLQHKIPVVQNCPPAPRKPRSEVLIKRKSSHSCHLQIELNDEIESVFRPLLVDPSRKFKKTKKGY